MVLQDGGSERGTLLAGEPVHEAVLRDGDVLELGSGGPRLRLRDEKEKQRIPLGKALAWARPEGSPRASPTRRFLARALVHETSVRTSPLFRWAVLLALAGGAAVLAWSQWQAPCCARSSGASARTCQIAEQERLLFYERIDEERRHAESDRSALEGQIEELASREEALNGPARGGDGGTGSRGARRPRPDPRAGC